MSECHVWSSLEVTLGAGEFVNDGVYRGDSQCDWTVDDVMTLMDINGAMEDVCTVILQHIDDFGHFKIH